MKIHLHIERLVVEGLALNGSERELLVSALQSRLTELLSGAPEGHGVFAGEHRAYLATQPGQLSGRPEPRLLGSQIGDAVGAALCGDSREIRQGGNR